MATWTKRLLLITLVTAAGLIQAGCTNLFFYPDQTVYITPDRLELDYEDIYITTGDDETIHGWWLPAQGKPRGLVYFLHGNAQNISSHVLNVAWLPEKGYSVFMIDYRGYGRSTGEPTLEGVLHDAESGLRWLMNNRHEDELPVFLLGQSLGGALGIVLASEWQQREDRRALDAVILDGTFAGFRDIAREKLDTFWLTWPFQAPLSWTIDNSYEGTEHIANISPTPVMIIHSVRDGIIPFHHGKELFDAAREPKEFLQTDTPHAATFVIPDYREKVIEFMEAAAQKEK